MQDVVGSLIKALLQIYCGIFQWKNFENRLRFDRIIAVILLCSFLAHLVEVDGRPVGDGDDVRVHVRTHRRTDNLKT